MKIERDVQTTVKLRGRTEPLDTGYWRVSIWQDKPASDCLTCATEQEAESALLEQMDRIEKELKG